MDQKDDMGGITIPTPYLQLQMMKHLNLKLLLEFVNFNLASKSLRVRKKRTLEISHPYKCFYWNNHVCIPILLLQIYFQPTNNWIIFLFYSMQYYYSPIKVQCGFYHWWNSLSLVMTVTLKWHYLCFIAHYYSLSLLKLHRHWPWHKLFNIIYNATKNFFF